MAAAFLLQNDICDQSNSSKIGRINRLEHTIQQALTRQASSRSHRHGSVPPHLLKRNQNSGPRQSHLPDSSTIPAIQPAKPSESSSALMVKPHKKPQDAGIRDRTDARCDSAHSPAARSNGHRPVSTCANRDEGADKSAGIIRSKSGAGAQAHQARFPIAVPGKRRPPGRLHSPAPASAPNTSGNLTYSSSVQNQHPISFWRIADITPRLVTPLWGTKLVLHANYTPISRKMQVIFAKNSLFVDSVQKLCRSSYVYHKIYVE